jgi:hypothetical protein
MDSQNLQNTLKKYKIYQYDSDRKERKRYNIAEAGQQLFR